MSTIVDFSGKGTMDVTRSPRRAPKPLDRGPASYRACWGVLGGTLITTLIWLSILAGLTVRLSLTFRDFVSCPDWSRP